MGNKSRNFCHQQKQCKLQFTFLELDSSKIVEHSVFIDEVKLTEQPRYDMIMGCNLMSELGIKLDFINRAMTWDGASTPMNSEN